MSKGAIYKTVLVSLLVFAGLFMLQQPLWAATTGKIAGTVKDAATGDPLPGVNIVISGTSMGGATDLEGHYFIINVPPGTHSLEASMIGYEALRKTGIRVIIDHTTPVDFALNATTIQGAEVTVTAEREIVQMDMSATQIAASADQIVQVPMVRNVNQYISLQAGIQGDDIRGGSIDETQFMMNGLVIVDNRTNQPLRMVNLSAVKEISVVKGGFNAEYGNLRSGLINIVTKEGEPRYSGSIDFRYSPAHLKHSGASVFNWENYYLRPYLDPKVMWVGTKNGWDGNTQNQFPSFIGWNAVSARVNGDKDPNNNMTPEQARDLFLWLHSAEGSGALGQKEGSYGNKPDVFVDGSFSGPVPIIGKMLGNMTFFASYSDNWDAFALPTSRSYYHENNGLFKLTTHLGTNIKLTADALYGEIKTVANGRAGSQYGTSSPFARSGQDILNFGYMDINNGDRYGLYYPGFFTPYTVFNSAYGLSMDHVLSPRTFYNVRVSWVNTRTRAMQGQQLRDRSTIVRYFGTYPVDESPYGVVRTPTPLLMEDGMYYGAHCDGARELSTTSSANIKFDLTSQMNRYNQVKLGLQFNYDDLFQHQEFNRWESDWENTVTEWQAFPWRIGAYLQDKIEFQGMIANVGLRVDYTNPNTEWIITDEKFPKYFRAKYEHLIFTEMEKEQASSQWMVQPRLGVSHPISKNAKLYFNYGHFYSMAPSNDMYRINYNRKSDGPYYVGNPGIRSPRTVAYELGWEYNISDMFRVQVSGYYKDIGDQPRETLYTSYDRLVNYRTPENRNYEDIRGFELTLEKNYGAWITGWLNYNYQVNTSGYVGRYQWYEDPRENAIYGLENPYQVVPLARPYARASIFVTSPSDFGPAIAGFEPLASIRWNTLFTYNSGRYETWDPLVTNKLKDNIHWKSSYGLDMRFSKTLRLAGLNAELFLDVQNLWENKEGTWPNRAFFDDTDKRRYLESLHLPMYKDDLYKNAGYIGGDDQPGNLRPDGVKFDPWEKLKANPNNDPAITEQNAAIKKRNEQREKDKSYIDNPNKEFLMDLYPRAYWFGIKLDF